MTQENKDRIDTKEFKNFIDKKAAKGLFEELFGMISADKKLYEQILDSPLSFHFNNICNMVRTMEELREALSELVHLHACEQEGLLSGKPTPEQWINAVNKAAKSLQS